MRYYIFEVHWSQTAREMCIVKAESESAARILLDSMGRYRFVVCYGKTSDILEA